jgi:hypothetical protein
MTPLTQIKTYRIKNRDTESQKEKEHPNLLDEKWKGKISPIEYYSGKKGRMQPRYFYAVPGNTAGNVSKHSIAA